MRHRKKTTKLGRTSAHRDALMASLVCNLIAEKRITTSVAKAKAARSLAEKMVTLGKKGTLAARRQAISKLRLKTHVAMLFDTIAPPFKERAGGYTRIVKLGRRPGDNSEQAILEWVESGTEKPTKAKTAKEEPAEKKASAKSDKAEGEEKKPKAKVKATKKADDKS